ncbi:MAG: hypothetical protein ACTSPI_11770 [Candidatus Heimdallarchaeaceae archaeon]
MGGGVEVSNTSSWLYANRLWDIRYIHPDPNSNDLDIGGVTSADQLDFSNWNDINFNGIDCNSMGHIYPSNITVSNDLNVYRVIVDTIQFSDGTKLKSTSTLQGKLLYITEDNNGVNVSSNVYITGLSSATYFYGDGSNLTNIGLASTATYAFTSGTATYAENIPDNISVSTITFLDGTVMTSTSAFAGDGLGDHTMTQNLNANGYDIYDVDKGTFNHIWVSSIAGTSPVYVDGGLITNYGLESSTLNVLGEAVFSSTVTALSLSFSSTEYLTTNSTGVYISSHTTVNGDIYANDVYTGDLHLKNDVGDWTLIESEEYLILRNNSTGKKFKILMEALPEE